MPGWRSLKIDDPADPPWSGDPGIWDPALASLGVRLRPVAGAPDDGAGPEFGNVA